LQEEVIVLEREMINLAQLLKATHLAGTGGQAKFLIGAGKVLVNGERETRIRRKLYPGDQVEIEDEIIIRLVKE